MDSAGTKDIPDPPRFTPEEEARLDKLFSWVEVLPVSNAVADAAIFLRRQRGMKLGDTLIGAAALLYNLPLVTQNVEDFQHIPSLQIINPFATMPWGMKPG